jgi:hypothetical protein
MVLSSVAAFHWLTLLLELVSKIRVPCDSNNTAPEIPVTDAVEAARSSPI